MRRLLLSTLAFSTLAALVFSPSIALADSSGDELAAEAAFGEGRTLMAKGDYAAACPKLEASQRLGPAIGTLLNLAECYAKSNRPASAWVKYKDAAGMALQAGQKEREQIARARVAELEPTLCKVVIKPTEPSAADGIRLARDGAQIDAGLLGIGIPIDPGPHSIVIAGDNKESVEKKFTIPNAQQNCPDTLVTFGPLVALPTPPTPPHTDAPIGEPPPQKDKPQKEDRGMSGRKIAALVVGGLGVAASGVGGGFALDAVSKKDQSSNECQTTGCTGTGKTLIHNAGVSADTATIFFVTGGVLIAAGVVLWITAPSAEKTARSPFAPLDGTIHF